MGFLHISSFLFSLAVLGSGLVVAEKTTMSGYIVDKLCNSMCDGAPEDAQCTPDLVNTVYHPEDHSGWCLLLPPCIASGYVLMSEEAGADGKHTIILDLAGSQDAVVSYLIAGTQGDFPRATVEYEETLQGEFGVLNAINATIRDTWDNSHYDGANVHQVICEDVSDADIESNNLCFRSDVVVSELGDTYVIESNGCPDHPNMQGGRGTVANSQPDYLNVESSGSSGGCDCGSTAASDCGSTATCDCGSTATCDSGSTATCDSGSNTTCDAGSGSVNSTTTRFLNETCGCGSTAASCCSSATSCCSSAASCCSSAASCCCGGCKSGNHTKSVHDPMFQHYTMIIPQAPGTPGEAKPITDDVVGIATNGVLLDSHKQTWAYDACNGHSDTKGQYHYHIPALCFMESLDIPFADSNEWWVDDEQSQVRTYSDMAAQFASTGPPSPVIGFARDGFPIYGIYDENGDLQRGADYGGDLDECNGKVGTDGTYKYHITVDPPFTPPCLKGDVGTFAYHKTDIACPADGISNKILTAAEADKCLEVTATSRSTGGPFHSLGDCDVSRDASPTDGAPSAVSRNVGLVATAMAAIAALFL